MENGQYGHTVWHIAEQGEIGSELVFKKMWFEQFPWAKSGFEFLNNEIKQQIYCTMWSALQKMLKFINFFNSKVDRKPANLQYNTTDFLNKYKSKWMGNYNF